MKIRSLKELFEVKEIKDVLYDQELTEAFISQHEDILDWEEISKTQTLNDDMVDKYSSYLDWDSMSKYQILSEYVIGKYSTKLNMSLVNENKRKYMDFIKDLRSSK